jgi:TetR/AcrR family transcriptional regulator
MSSGSSAGPIKKRRGKGRPQTSAQSIGREALLKLTCELMKTHHHRHITRVLVARQAGVDASLLRYYFKSHHEMLTETAERLTQEFAEFLRTASAVSGNSPEGRLCARVHAIVELTATYPFYSRFIAEEIIHSDSESARAIFGTLMDRGISKLDEIVADGLASGTFRKIDPKMLFSTIVGMAEFFLHTRRRAQVSSYPDDGESLATLKDRYKAFICDLLFAGMLSGNRGVGEFDRSLAKMADDPAARAEDDQG